MKTTILSLLGILLLSLPQANAQKPKEEVKAPQTGETSQQREEIAIRAAFERYRIALSGQDGPAASEMLSRDALQVYDHYREAALAGTKEEIVQIPLVHQAAILVLRGKIPGEQLINMTGKEVYSASISSGLIAHKWAESMEIINVELPDPRTAVLTIGIKGNPGTRMLAVKEGTQWKFSVREILMQSNQTIEELLTTRGINPEDYLKNVVETQLGPNTFTTIWEAPAQRVRRPQDQGVVWEEMPQ